MRRIYLSAWRQFLDDIIRSAEKRFIGILIYFSHHLKGPDKLVLRQTDTGKIQRKTTKSRKETKIVLNN